jgi:hypothetical protein
VRKRTDCDRSKIQAVCIMNISSSASMAPPVEVFYVVQSTGNLGERHHRLRSALYESRPQAETELARLRAAESAGSYGVWKSVTYIEPAEWLHRIVRSDGTLILPRLQRVEKCTDA